MIEKMKFLSDKAEMWVIQQAMLKSEGVRNAEDIARLLIKHKQQQCDYEPVRATYLGFMDCLVCGKKIDCIRWDGFDYYLEIDLRKDTPSPVHWCELTGVDE